MRTAFPRPGCADWRPKRAGRHSRCTQCRQRNRGRGVPCGTPAIHPDFGNGRGPLGRYAPAAPAALGDVIAIDAEARDRARPLWSLPDLIESPFFPDHIGAFLLVLGPLVVLHELGHYWWAALLACAQCLFGRRWQGAGRLDSTNAAPAGSSPRFRWAAMSSSPATCRCHQQTRSRWNRQCRSA
jgi:hypothetical protein